jgi:hypothetical protein
MALSSLGSLQLTLRELKQIIAGITGEEHESCRLAGQMEALAAEIEKKSGELIGTTEPVALSGAEGIQTVPPAVVT